jgi:AcrR family transcriptional regulator
VRRSATLDVSAILTGLSPATRHTDFDDAATAAILDAARALLARHGLGRWSMDDLASSARVGRATVYRRFESREDVVNAAIARDLRRFFATVAEAVAGVPDLTGKVVEGFLIGVPAARGTLLPELFQTDSSEVMALLSAAPVVDLGRAALVGQYEVITGQKLHGSALAEVELVAEALIRLALSFLLIPGSSIDFDDEESARSSIRRLVTPLLNQ